MNDTFKKLNIVTLVVTLLIASTNILAQDKNAATAGDSTAKEPATKSGDKNKEEKLYGSYLDTIHAKDNALHNSQINQKLLKKLKIAVGNFGTDAENSIFKKLSDDYKDGIKDIYKREFLVADQKLTKNRKDIENLYNSMIDQYTQKAGELLSQCADALVEGELSINSDGTSTPESVGDALSLMQKNKFRLAIAYDQYNMGVQAQRDENIYVALAHLRYAKLQAIAILEDLAGSTENKDKIRDMYKKDFADAENRIAKSGT